MGTCFVPSTHFSSLNEFYYLILRTILLLVNTVIVGKYFMIPVLQEGSKIEEVKIKCPKVLS